MKDFQNNIKKWYHDCFQVFYSFIYLFFGWLPEIKKLNYKRYDKPKDGVRELTQKGYCYYLFYSHRSLKGFRIPFTLRITKRFDSSQPLEVKK